MARVWHGGLPWPDRFWAKVERGEDCWLFNGATTGDGYAVIQIDGRARPAHRVAWELVNGPIPEGLLVRHRCDVRRCIRPKHLELGTHDDNMEDMRVRNRAASGDRNAMRLHPDKILRGDAHWSHRHPELVKRGEANGFAKLTAPEVLSIRNRWERGDSLSAIAVDYGLTTSAVSRVGRRTTWAHVPGPAPEPRRRGVKEGRWH